MTTDLIKRLSLGAGHAIDLARNRADWESDQALQREVYEVVMNQASEVAHQSLQVAA